MKQNRFAIFVTLLAFLLVFTIGAAVLAQSSANFDISWHVIGNGGGEASSASYQVNGTIGQGVTSQPSADSANFTVNSGYWAVGAGTAIYLPLIISD